MIRTIEFYVDKLERTDMTTYKHVDVNMVLLLTYSHSLGLKLYGCRIKSFFHATAG